jgi:hypothetical protein
MGTSRLEIFSDGSEAVFYFQIHDGTDPAAGVAIKGFCRRSMMFKKKRKRIQYLVTIKLKPSTSQDQLAPPIEAGSSQSVGDDDVRRPALRLLHQPIALRTDARKTLSTSGLAKNANAPTATA